MTALLKPRGRKVSREGIELYHAKRSLPCGRIRFTPPRNSAGNTFPSQIVVFTTAGHSCGDTLPYHTPEPWGVYICFMSGKKKQRVSNQAPMERSSHYDHSPTWGFAWREDSDTYHYISTVLVTSDMRIFQDKSLLRLTGICNFLQSAEEFFLPVIITAFDVFQWRSNWIFHLCMDLVSLAFQGICQSCRLRYVGEHVRFRKI